VIGLETLDDDVPAWTEEVKKQSFLPIVIAALLLVVSITMIFVGRAWPLPLLGWVLTPFGVVACLAWARAVFVKNSGDPWFDRVDAKRKVLVLQALTLIAFLVSLPHVWRIGQEAALWFQ
jgi:hypothetical protein